MSFSDSKAILDPVGAELDKARLRVLMGVKKRKKKGESKRKVSLCTLSKEKERVIKESKERVRDIPSLD